MIVDELKDTLYIDEFGIICRIPSIPDVAKRNCKEELFRLLRINEKNQSIDFKKDVIFNLSLYTTREMKCICSTKIENVYYIQNIESGNTYAIGCECIENNFNKELGTTGKNLKSEYQKKKKSMKKEFDELTDYRSRLEKNRNKIENNYEGINSLDESTERKKRELQLVINRIIIQMNECIIYPNIQKSIKQFISDSGISYVRNTLISSNWSIKNFELRCFIYHSDCRTIKDFVENELIEFEFEHPICKCNQKKTKFFDKEKLRWKYCCPNKPNYCNNVYPEYGELCGNDRKPLLDSIQEGINNDIEYRNRLINTRDYELKNIDREIKRTNREIEELKNKINEFTFIES